MRLRPEDAIIQPAKIREYLLSPTHPDGGSKAAFLVKLGYSQEEWQRREADLRTLLVQSAESGKPSDYGQRYEILGTLTGPNGTSARVRTIWIVLTGESRARLVTLIPEERR